MSSRDTGRSNSVAERAARRYCAGAAGRVSTLRGRCSSPSASRRRWRRPVIIGAALLVLVAGARWSPTWSSSNRNDDVHRGDEVEFTRAAAAQAEGATRCDWPFYHYDRAHTGYLPADIRPPFKERWVFSGQGADGVPVDRRRRQRLLHAQQRRDVPARRRHRQGEVEEPARARCRPPPPPTRTGACSSARCRARSSRCGRATASSCGRSSSAAAPSPRRSCATASSTSAPRAARSTRCSRKHRPREVEVPGRRRDQGLAGARPAARSTSATTAGRMYAVWARTGPRALVDRHLGDQARLRARATSTRRRRSPSAASTSATPTARSTRSARKTGDARLDASRTGGYVYSSPAVANRAGHRPTVYIGSYDGNLYALDARTGSMRWTARGGGRISGGPTVIGNIVYFADLDSKSTYGVDARTGKRVFQRSRGALQPGRLGRPAALPDRLRQRHRARPGPQAAPQRPLGTRPRRVESRLSTAKFRELQVVSRQGGIYDCEGSTDKEVSCHEDQQARLARRSGRPRLRALTAMRCAIAQPVKGTNGDDTLTGTDRHDVHRRLARQRHDQRAWPAATSSAPGDGNDTVDGGDGRDFVRGGDGDDTQYGGPKGDIDLRRARRRRRPTAATATTTCGRWRTRTSSARPASRPTR